MQNRVKQNLKVVQKELAVDLFFKFALIIKDVYHQQYLEYELSISKENLIKPFVFICRFVQFKYKNLATVAGSF